MKKKWILLLSLMTLLPLAVSGINRSCVVKHIASQTEARTGRPRLYSHITLTPLEAQKIAEGYAYWVNNQLLTLGFACDSYNARGSVAQSILCISWRTIEWRWNSTRTFNNILKVSLCPEPNGDYFICTENDHIVATGYMSFERLQRLLAESWNNAAH